VGFLLLFTFFRMARWTGWDEAFYLAQLTSVLWDGDLLLHNDLLDIDNPPALEVRALTTVLDSGALQNTFSVGPALIHAAYAWPLAFRPRDPARLRAVLAVGAMLIGVLTVLLTREVVRGLLPGTPAGLAVALAVAGGPLALYGTREYLGSHLLSACLSALTLAAALFWLRSGAPRHALLLGLAAGLLVAIRWQDLLLAAAIVPALLLRLREDPGRRRVWGLAAALGAFGLPTLVQLGAWKAQYGVWWLIPQGPGYMRWTDPQLRHVLLSTFHGLLPWAPGFALGILALVRWAAARRPEAPRSERALAWGLVASAVGALYVCACVVDWWGGDAYGARRLASLTPLAAIGLAHLLGHLRMGARLALAVAVALWAGLTLTSQLSGFDDLRVAAGRAPAAENPRPPGTYERARWIDAAGAWPEVLRPGFTFSDAPRNADRVVGAVATALILGTALALWRGLRWPAVQRTLIAAATTWVVVASVYAAAFLPANAGANRVWRSVVRGEVPAGARGTLPPALASAARIVEDLGEP
jgi:hypothetical protein